MRLGVQCDYFHFTADLVDEYEEEPVHGTSYMSYGTLRVTVR